MNQWLIAIGYAIVYLTVSIVFNAWKWSWVIWAGYAAYRVSENRANRK